LDVALRAVNDALARWPDNVRFIAEKARILQRLGRLGESGALLKPLRTRPEAHVYRLIVSQALLERRYVDAIPVLEAQFVQKPDEVTTANLKLDLGRLRALAGDAKNAEQDLKEARTLLEAASLRQPKNASLLNALAL